MVHKLSIVFQSNKIYSTIQFLKIKDVIIIVKMLNNLSLLCC